MARYPTLDEQIEEVEREIAQRSQLYEKFLREGKIPSKAEAERRMDRMIGVLNTLRQLRDTASR